MRKDSLTSIIISPNHPSPVNGASMTVQMSLLIALAVIGETLVNFADGLLTGWLSEDFK